MTMETELGGWALCGGRDKAKPASRNPGRRRHAGLVLELALLLALALLLPRARNRK